MKFISEKEPANVFTLPYQLKREEVDVPAMVDRAKNRLLQLRKQAMAAILVSPVWGEYYPSVKDFRFRTQYRGYSKDPTTSERVGMLEPNTGAINILSSNLAASELGGFFTPLRTRQQGDFTQLRGLTYYTALNFSRNTPAKKLEVMTKDIKEGLDVMSSVDRRNLSSVDYLVYLGILDHLKFHALTAFHALTFHERTGILPDDEDYLSTRREAQGVMSTLTRAYYQACLGQSFDAQFNRVKLEESVDKVADYVVHSSHSIAHFTFPEVINPLTIILGAHEAARRKSYLNTIIGIPSGGTEVAVATSLMYESLYPKLDVLDTAFVPLSFHYHGQGGVSRDQLVQMLTRSNKLEGKYVLIVDDNSNSGSTLQGMSEAVIKAGASQVLVHLAEIDPARVMAKHSRGERRFGVVNMDHPDLYTAMGIAGALDKDGGDLRRKEISRFVKKAHQKIEKVDVGFQHT